MFAIPIIFITEVMETVSTYWMLQQMMSAQILFSSLEGSDGKRLAEMRGIWSRGLKDWFSWILMVYVAGNQIQVCSIPLAAAYQRY
jgi:hypothetical protein